MIDLRFGHLRFFHLEMKISLEDIQGILYNGQKFEIDDETMGRVRAAENFVRTLQKREKPLNTPDEAVKLMKIIDAIYASAKTGAPVRIR